MARRWLAALWVGLSLGLFVLLLVAPVPDATTTRGSYECPSLLTILRLGHDPTAAEKGQFGIRGGATYYQCRSGPTMPWAAAVVLVPSLLCTGGLTVLGRSRRSLTA